MWGLTGFLHQKKESRFRRNCTVSCHSEARSLCVALHSLSLPGNGSGQHGCWFDLVGGGCWTKLSFDTNLRKQLTHHSQTTEYNIAEVSLSFSHIYGCLSKKKSRLLPTSKRWDLAPGKEVGCLRILFTNNGKREFVPFFFTSHLQNCKEWLKSHQYKNPYSCCADFLL